MKTPKTLIESKKGAFQKVIDHLQHEFSGIRTGRAHPALVENLPIEMYGTQSTIKAVASIVVSGAQTIVISPWDKNAVAEVEKAVKAANLGIQPVNDGASIRLNLPALTEERRKELTKIIGQQSETARVGIRAVREEIWKEATRLTKEKEFTEDQKFETQDELKKIVDSYNDQIKQLAEKKEQEVLAI
jgi:ribosome recycling factor